MKPLRLLLPKPFGSFIPRTYRGRISVSLAAAFLVVIVIFAFAVHYRTNDLLERNQYEANRKALAQVKHTIEYMNDVMKQTALAIFFNADIAAVMSKDNSEANDSIVRFNRAISSITSTQTFIDSIYVYNPRTQSYWSAGNRNYDSDRGFQELAASPGRLPKLKPVLRTVELGGYADNKAYKNVFTYLMYDNEDAGGPRGVVVNIDADWLFDNIAAVTREGKRGDDAIFLADRGGRLAAAGSDAAGSLLAGVGDAYAGRLMAGRINAEEGFFPARLGGEQYLIAYTGVDNTDWVLLRAQHFGELYRYINQIKTSLYAITGLFALLALAISFLVAKGIYRPIGGLVRTVSSHSAANRGWRRQDDEIGYLHDHFLQRQQSNAEIAKSYFLRRLLTESAEIDIHELGRSCAEYRLPFDPQRPFRVCVVRLDRYRRLERQLAAKELQLYRFSVRNIVSELLSRSLACEMLEFRRDQAALIVQPPVGAGGREEWSESLREAQDFVARHYPITFSAAIGGEASFKDLTRSYDEAQHNLAYTFVYGSECIILPDTVPDAPGNRPAAYDGTAEKRLFRDIRSGNADNVRTGLLKVCNEISTLPAGRITPACAAFVHRLKAVVEEIAAYKGMRTAVAFDELVSRLPEYDTLDEWREALSEQLFRTLAASASDPANDKKTQLAEAAKQLIQAGYADPAMSLRHIADSLKLSTEYAGKAFKAATGLSVAEYLNDIRLTRAAELLENGNVPVGEVAMAVGVENETYFYKMFKKKYGVTPREYTFHHKRPDRSG
ncbi:MAG: AraC family transcriptional regulator [Paenibacillaceae bacterium]|nr:AraC family transcriptional regulator [Paenibacillaceae bacterium]